jgi:hypothetical protein
MISSVFIRRPRMAIVISLVITIAGYMAYKALPVAQFPDIVPPQVQVTAIYPGADANALEESVAQVIEPAINGVDDLLNWWLTDVRHQFGDDWDNPDAPLLPSERHDPLSGHPNRAVANTLRCGLTGAVDRWLPAWQRRLTPHVLRHYCASSLYHHGMALTAIQELLGHEWLQTTTIYIHVHDEHIERAWAEANQRLTDRFGLPPHLKEG